MTVEMPERSAPRCDICGEETITNCPSCEMPIRGYYYSEDQNIPLFESPKFCSSCGKPYPWTDKRIQLAKELVDETKGINRAGGKKSSWGEGEISVFPGAFIDSVRENL